MENVGCIGLGIMGRPMALNLIKAGCAIMVSDINRTVVDELIGAGAETGSYREIGEDCDIIITILPNGAIVQSSGKPDVLSEAQRDRRWFCRRACLRW